jgi:hypothetical protein
MTQYRICQPAVDSHAGPSEGRTPYVRSRASADDFIRPRSARMARDCIGDISITPSSRRGTSRVIAFVSAGALAAL